MSFRRRLAWTITAVLVAGYVAFALISVALLESTLRGEMDAKLTTLARAAGDIVDDKNGKPSVDADDVSQFNALHGSDEHLGIFDLDGNLIFGETPPAPDTATKVRMVTTQAVHNGHHLGSVRAWRDSSWIGTVRSSALLTFLVTGSALAALAFFFSGIYARKILMPVERVANLAERLETSDLSQRLNANGRDELGRLCASFDRMLERLQRSFETERRFVSDASHELRAPLAVVRAETDLALRRERSAEEYRLALESIDRETSRLEALVDDLLQTMRHRAIVETRPIDAVEVLRGLAARMRHAARIAIDARGTASIVRGDRASIERALSAILHNAVTHGGDDVRVTIVDDGESLVIEICDDGAGFSPEALTHATERFWRGDSARSRGGTGLGLSIARVLVEAHGGTLTLDNDNRGGAIVRIALPRFEMETATV